jgi:hypothetical protein
MFSNPPMPAPVGSYPPASTTSTAPDADGGAIFNAAVQTLNRLHNHFDGKDLDTPRVSPIFQAVVKASEKANRRSAQRPHPRQSQSSSNSPTPIDIEQMKEQLRQEMRIEIRRELDQDRAALEEKLDSVQRTQEMILEMLRQEPA